MASFHDNDFSDIDDTEMEYMMGFNETVNDSDISMSSDDDSDDDVPLVDLIQRQNVNRRDEEVGGMIQQIVDETNKYATKKQLEKPDDKWRNVTFSEIRAYLGFQIVMGIIAAPNLDMYWSSDPMFSPCGIKERMTRDRYDKISKYFHVADTSCNPARGQPGHDKLSHVRPILEAVRVNLMANYKPHRETTVDEAMIGYTGRLGSKQYVPMKPTKRGIKVWVRADPHNGYVNDIQVYLGKENRDGDKGLGERVVMDLVTPILNRGHHVYCDNYFTTAGLFEELQQQGTYACGTFRSNRRGIPDEIKQQKLKEQGTSIMMQKENMVATAWRDKKTVFILSTNFDPTTPRTTVQRRQKDGSQKDVSCPESVRNYTKYMNGVDHADQLRAMYSLARKSAKWWKYLFWFLVDLAIVGAYILMKESPNHQQKTRTGKPKPLTQLDFRKKLAKQLIGDFMQKRKRDVLKENIQLQGRICWPANLGKRRTCKMCSKNGKRRETQYGCEGCGVNLCVECYKPYHVETFPERSGK
ncbi:piggyBac transposable element-derived protein 4-like [Mercenaria mercenaria]|uniref:piggyBac transposable element-derived protein 4-like n=1 Tax=Mercenaria mercenaria TaxID=6596 RepID=UPI00234F47AC|nr:piggyBac transposable element-derived protein 4-like [Mercenaria mercenaria]